jgi:hypothetical protein
VCKTGSSGTRRSPVAKTHHYLNVCVARAGWTSRLKNAVVIVAKRVTARTDLARVMDLLAARTASVRFWGEQSAFGVARELLSLDGSPAGTNSAGLDAILAAASFSSCVASASTRHIIPSKLRPSLARVLDGGHQAADCGRGRQLGSMLFA